MDNNKQNILDKVQELFIKYKENETKKILQIFHVTVLVIVALLSEKTTHSPIIAYTLLLSFIFIALSYFFLYLTDICNATTSAYTYIKESTPNEPAEPLQSYINKYFELSRDCSNWCLFCTITSYMLLFISIFIIFNIKLVQCYYMIAFLIPVYILFKAIKYYIKITNN